MTTTNPTRIACLFFAWGVGGIATLTGLGGVLLTGWYIQQDRASQSWPEVMGLITSSRIESSTTNDSLSEKNTIRRSDTDYSVELRYTYQVEGQTYEGRRLRFGSN